MLPRIERKQNKRAREFSEWKTAVGRGCALELELKCLQNHSQQIDRNVLSLLPSPSQHITLDHDDDAPLLDFVDFTKITVIAVEVHTARRNER